MCFFVSRWDCVMMMMLHRTYEFDFGIIFPIPSCLCCCLATFQRSGRRLIKLSCRRKGDESMTSHNGYQNDVIVTIRCYVTFNIYRSKKNQKSLPPLLHGALTSFLLAHGKIFWREMNVVASPFKRCSFRNFT